VASTDLARLRYAALLLIPLAVALAVIDLTPLPALAGITGDLRVYFEDGGRLLAGVTPYRGFALEYPPVALVPMTLPRLLWPFGTISEDIFQRLFGVMEGCVAVVVGWLIARIADAPLRAVAIWALLALAAGVSITWRYDIWPALCVLCAIIAVERDRPGLAGLAIGVGTMLKLFPIVVLAILVARCIALRDRAGLLRLVGGTAAAIGILMGVSVALAGGDAFQWVTYELDRGLQLESTGAGLLLLLHAFAGQPASTVIAFGTVQVIAPGADAVVAATPFVEVLLVGAFAILALMRFRRDVARLGEVPLSSLAVAVVGILVALLVSSKVFSVQYIVWFLPIAPLLPGRLPWMALAVAALSTFIYPLNYTPVWQLDPAMTVVLNLRTGLLVALLVWLGIRLIGPRRSPLESAP
jgi:hypothetical protein